MGTPFQIPEWLFQSSPPPPPEPVDDHRLEGLVNRFIAGKQEALFTAPDAFYRLQADDAVQGRPAIAQRLLDLRAETLDQARNASERAALDPRLDLHLDDAMDGIDRHVAEQRRVHHRQIVAQRQALIQRAAELEHDNDNKILGLAEANATAAGEAARMDGIVPDSPEAAAAALGARSSILRTAISERIANGKNAQALALFDRIKDQLAPADRVSLDTPVQATRNDELANQWIDRESKADGPPLQQRVETDPNLPLDIRPIVRAKVDARDSADEAARAAKVQPLDDEVDNAVRSQVVNPNAYRPGTFARLAVAYEAVGDAGRATFARRMAAQDAFIAPFTQASAEKQQRMIGELPPGELRNSAIAIRDGQVQSFAGDAFAAGTTIYKEVGSPLPIDDIEGRVRQARQISQLRGGIAVVPFSRDEIAAMRREPSEDLGTEKQERQLPFAVLPTDMLRTVYTPEGNEQSKSENDNSIIPTSIPSDGADDSRRTDPDKENAIEIADDRKTYCLERCSNLILMKPFSRRPGTFDECFAHCEGRMYFRHIEPFIPFPNR